MKLTVNFIVRFIWFQDHLHYILITGASRSKRCCAANWVWADNRWAGAQNVLKLVDVSGPVVCIVLVGIAPVATHCNTIDLAEGTCGVCNISVMGVDATSSVCENGSG